MSNEITPNPSVPSQVVAEVKFPQVINNLGIIPTSYKDSMSYYETLAWLCKYLEETVIPSVNQNGNAVQELQNLYIQLNEYVTNYFDNLDVQEEINNKLDSMVQSGELQQLLALQYSSIKNELETKIANETNAREVADENILTQLSSVASGSPLVASSTSEMTNTSRIYVNTTDGDWYYYNGTNWTSGGTYQADGISPDDPELDGRNVNSLNLPYNYGVNKFDMFENFVQGAVQGQVGVAPVFTASTTRIRCDEDHLIAPGVYNIINMEPTNYDYLYTIVDDETGVATAISAWIGTKETTLTVSSGTHAIIQIRKHNNTDISLNEGLSNIRLKSGTISRFALPNIYAKDPINFDSINHTMTIKAGTYLIIDNNKIAISEDTTVSFPAGNQVHLILLNLLNNAITIQLINNSISSNQMIIGYFQLNETLLEHAEINAEYTINGLIYPNNKYYLNNNVLYRIDNINPTTNGINHSAQSQSRVSSYDYFSFDGTIIVRNKDNINYYFAIQKYSLVEGVYTRVGDTGWLSLAQYSYNVSKDYFYLFVSKKANNGNYTVKEAIENFYIENIYGSISYDNISIYKPNINNFISVGHQGNGAGTLGTRGNSKTGFVNGALHGYQELECDVVATSDGVIVLNHDLTITDDESTTYTIGEITYEELSEKEFDGEKICTLDEFLEICKRYGTRARIDHIGNIWNSTVQRQTLINSIKKYQMSRFVTFTVSKSIWETLLEEFPYATYIESHSVYDTSVLSSAYIASFVTLQNNYPNAKFGMAFNYDNYNTELTFNTIATYSNLIFEFWTIDDLTDYNAVVPYCSAVTSNTYTGYEALIEYRS